MTKKEFKRPALRHSRHYLVKQLFSGWPWLVWLSAAIAVLLLLPGGMHRIRFYGVAERTYEYVAPLEDGRLEKLYVDMGETIHAGQLLGKLSNASLATDLLMDQASLMKTRDKIHSIRYELAQLKLEEAKTAANLQTMKSSWERTQKLLAKNLVLEQDVEDLGPQITAMQIVLDHYPNLIARLSERLEAAESDAASLDSEKLEQLQEKQCQLEATTAGVVAEILHRPGDVVETGEPVLRISNVSTKRVIAFMPEKKRVDLPEGEKCRVITSEGREIFEGTVQTVTADIRKLPVFTGFGDQILRGRRIVIELDEGVILTPGERVVVVPDISLKDQWFGRS